MRRNLDRRVEAITPIEDPSLKKQLEKLLDIYLNDNCNAWEMQSDGRFIQRQRDGEELSSQEQLKELWSKGFNSN